MLSFQGRLHPCAVAFGKGGCVIIKIQVFSYKPVKIQVSFVSVWNLCCVKDPRPELLDNPRLFRNKGSKKKERRKVGSKVQIPGRREKDVESGAEEEEISGGDRCSSSRIRPNLLGKKPNRFVPLPAEPAQEESQQGRGKPQPWG